jgi:hypothetical protein
MSDECEEMSTYWLYANMMYNIKHVKRVTWWRRLFGKQQLWLAECEAVSEDVAAKKFRLMGYDFGPFSRHT